MVHPDEFRVRHGFKRIDLLVIVVVIALLVGILLPILRYLREASETATCQNNLKQIGISIHNYTSNNKDRLPPMLDHGLNKPTGWKPFWASLLPYLESSQLVRSNTAESWDNGNHAEIVKCYLCPADSSHKNGLSPSAGWSVTSYAPVYQLFGTSNDYDPDKKVWITQATFKIVNVPDGTSQQIAVVERFGDFPSYGWGNLTFYPCSHSYWGWNQWGSVYGVWGLNPPQIEVSPADAHPYRPNSGHETAQILILDGSVRRISPRISETTWAAACQPDDGARLGDDW